MYRPDSTTKMVEKARATFSRWYAWHLLSLAEPWVSQKTVGVTAAKGVRRGGGGGGGWFGWWIQKTLKWVGTA